MGRGGVCWGLGMSGVGGFRRGIRIPNPVFINFWVIIQQCLPVVSLLNSLF